MKKTTRIFAFLLLSFSMFLLTSCNRDDDPADNDFFAGTYNGSVGFVEPSSGTNISSNDGKVFVTKIASGTKYNFSFSNGIPDLNGVEFQKQGDNVLINVNSSATAIIKIDNNDLDIFYTADGKTWTANCTR